MGILIFAFGAYLVFVWLLARGESCFICGAKKGDTPLCPCCPSCVRGK